MYILPPHSRCSCDAGEQILACTVVPFASTVTRSPLLLHTLGLLLLICSWKALRLPPRPRFHTMLQFAKHAQPDTVVIPRITPLFFRTRTPSPLHSPALVLTPIMTRMMPRSPGEELKVSSQEALAILRDIAAATGASATGGGDDGGMGPAAAAAGGVLGGGVAGSQARKSACRLVVAAAKECRHGCVGGDCTLFELLGTSC